jgi:hypothetical protein
MLMLRKRNSKRERLNERCVVQSPLDQTVQRHVHQAEVACLLGRKVRPLGLKPPNVALEGDGELRCRNAVGADSDDYFALAGLVDVALNAPDAKTDDQQNHETLGDNAAAG